MESVLKVRLYLVRKLNKMTLGNITKFKSVIDQTNHISLRKLAIKFGCGRTDISKTINKTIRRLLSKKDQR